MYGLGLSECLREHNGRITPTYKNSKGKKEVIHQMDHLYVTSDLHEKRKHCFVGDQATIFSVDRPLSDHLPIIAEFAD